MKKIKKIDIDLLSEHTQSKYNEDKARFIAGAEEYVQGSYFSFGHYKKVPLVGESRWNNMYPNGYEDWLNEQSRLTSSGEQQLIDKINEIVDVLNKK